MVTVTNAINALIIAIIAHFSKKANIAMKNDTNSIPTSTPKYLILPPNEASPNSFYQICYNSQSCCNKYKGSHVFLNVLNDSIKLFFHDFSPLKI